MSSSSNVSQTSSTSAPRRFVPQVLETSRRSRRKSRNADNESMPAKPARSNERRHSFRVPDLPSIRSSSESESAEEHPKSSPLWSRRNHVAHHHTGTKGSSSRGQRVRSSVHVQRRAQAVGSIEERLQDQALAAYPNETVHEPVDHYAFDQDSGDDREPGRQAHRLRQKPSEEEWDVLEMRRHQEELERRSQTTEHKSFADIARDTDAPRDSWQRPVGFTKDAFPRPKSPHEDAETLPQRKAASPPMAGADLKFPKCLSPQATRLDVHQYPGQNKTSSNSSKKHTGLWTPGGGSSPKVAQTGLWMGVNDASAQVTIPRAMQAGLMTPAFERVDPLAAAPQLLSTSPSPHAATPQKNETPNTSSEVPQLLLSPDMPSPMDGGTRGNIEEHFPDSFVTQLYNYLSLGYPTMARPYDTELSRITRVPVETLRARDYTPHQAHIRSSTSTKSQPDISECERWKALKAYVWEWGRQNDIESRTTREDGVENLVIGERPDTSSSLGPALGTADVGMYGWSSGINGRKGSWAC